jgi:hypothetical protein
MTAAVKGCTTPKHICEGVSINTHTHVYGSTVHKSQAVGHPTTDGWIKQMRCVYTMEYSSAINKNEITLSARRMGGAEDQVEIGPARKAKHCLFLLTWNPDLK